MTFHYPYLALNHFLGTSAIFSKSLIKILNSTGSSTDLSWTLLQKNYRMTIPHLQLLFLFLLANQFLIHLLWFTLIFFFKFDPLELLKKPQLSGVSAKFSAETVFLEEAYVCAT